MGPGLPDTFDVTLPEGQTANVRIGTGAEVLAYTEWACYRSLGDSFIVRAEFGPRGEIARFFDNAVYFPEILGTELIPDGLVRSNPFPGMTYAAGSFGASIDNQFGFAAPLNVWMGPVKVGTGVAYAYGTIEGDRLEGIFGYTTQILAPGSPFGSGATDMYPFYGVRER